MALTKNLVSHAGIDLATATSSGEPVVPDESGWTQWGSSQPLIWNKNGDLRNNKGSVANLPHGFGDTEAIVPST